MTYMQTISRMSKSSPAIYAVVTGLLFGFVLGTASLERAEAEIVAPHTANHKYQRMKRADASLTPTDNCPVYEVKFDQNISDLMATSPFECL